MKFLNERNQVRTVAARWKQQCHGTAYQPIGPLLAALDPETATAEDVAAIIGHYSWVNSGQCNECGVRSWQLVQLGEEPNYESCTAYICLPCLQQAVALCEVAP